VLSFLPAPVLGCISFVFFALNLVFWSTPLYVVILIKLLVPAGPLRDRVSRFAADIAQQWAHCNTLYCDVVMKMEWDVRMPENLSANGQYLVCANHQTWNDIFVVMKAFGRRAPFFKFFLKQELIWVPVLGFAWWGLDFPFMKRYTPEQVAANPALKGKDLETTRKACERYKNVPALILNYLEGTRFTPAKHARQQSPYRHLLKPKSGGFAFSISALGEKINSLLDVTIVYPEGAKGFSDLLMGRVHKVIVEVRQLTIPHEFYTGNYESDPVFRKRFQDWIAEIWAQKDQRISQLLAEAGVPA
jgi:1-acyl-sn-glycerol-3-phosphate acyltransferase